MLLHGQDHPGLQTDLYELTMAAAYFQTGKYREYATFELSVRSLPASRSFLLAAGLEQVMQYFEEFGYTGEEIDYLKEHPTFEGVNPAFFDYLAGLRFSGSVWAIPEGTPVFAEEPVLRVTAPIAEAQIAETYLLAMLTYQTSVATKAARIVRAAAGKGVVEFGTRRAHGPRAGLLAARASYIAGCMGTSNVLAGFALGVPIFGTSAHSWTMSFETEEDALREFAKIYGQRALLLIDTYDSIEGARKALALGLPFRGVRLDSGDLLESSREVRKILDAGGRPDAVIVASGDLNEYRIGALLDQNAPIDLFGVGTDLVTSRDAPSLNGVYKMVEIAEHGVLRPTAKFSESKISYPGRKQVFRFSNPNGEYTHDMLGLADENFPNSEPLLEPVMENGKRLGPSPTLQDIRDRAAAALARLPEDVQALGGAATYRVEKSAALLDLLQKVRSRYVPLPSSTPERR
ncbi:MAG: nicotinate phosphoribosyltransferase [Acidobacteria bacterium]|nr:nicotinate phosphoribosyltransferase [Acidobacteriota bacterium]